MAPELARAPASAAQLLRLWLLALLDDGGRASLTFFTQVLSLTPR